MAMLKREDILAAQDMQSEDVDVPEWGGTVRVSVMTGEARDQWDQGLVTVDAKGKAKANMGNIRARLVALTVVDETGQRLFTAEDVAELGRKNGAALNRVFEAAQRLNLLRAQDVEQAKGN